MKVFHHNDADGRCAAAIVLKHAVETGLTVTEFIEMDYAKQVPFGKLVKGELIVLVDFSFKEDDMRKAIEILGSENNVTWIDHHKTAKDYFYNDFSGMRDFTDKGLSGCELTWKYYNPTKNIPWPVKLIGDYDSWRMELKPSCLEFYEGLKLEDQTPVSKLWMTLLCGQSDIETDYTHTIMEKGRSAIKYRDMYCADLRKGFGFECTLNYADGLKCYALNAYKFGSQAYGELMQLYEVLIAFIFDGNKMTVSLYSEKPEIDVSIIAKKLGGGGHKGAAGFVVENSNILPFKRI